MLKIQINQRKGNLQQFMRGNKSHCQVGGVKDGYRLILSDVSSMPTYRTVRLGWLKTGLCPFHKSRSVFASLLLSPFASTTLLSEFLFELLRFFSWWILGMPEWLQVPSDSCMPHRAVISALFHSRDFQYQCFVTSFGVSHRFRRFCVCVRCTEF